MRRLLHVAVHNGVNQNAGDTLLSAATRWLFDATLGPSQWTCFQAWEPFAADYGNTFDGVVVGGGGMLLPDQSGAHYEASGWQWNCTLEELDNLTVPLILFGIGYNRFRDQQDFVPPFYDHWVQTCCTAQFVGLRERAAQHWCRNYSAVYDPAKIHYQPCPTTCLWQLCELGTRLPSMRKVLAVNVATDRHALRFGTDAVRRRVFAGIIHACEWAYNDGWQIEVVCHKPQDTEIVPWLERSSVPFAVVPLWEAGPERIVEYYAEVDAALGMRGHAQLIPLGMRKPIISVISHEKVKWFLEDIGHPEWGVDVQDPYFDMRLMARLRQVLTGHAVSAHVVEAQHALWQTTMQNMQMIAEVLACKPSTI